MKKYRYNIVVITTVFFISNVAYTESNIQQGDILAFDPSIACDVLAIKLEKIEEEIDKKQRTIKELHKILISAAKRPPNYGNIRSDYIRTFDQLKSMKQDYDRLVVQRENHCMPNSDENSTN